MAISTSRIMVIAIDTRRDMPTGLHIWSSTIISSIISFGHSLAHAQYNQKLMHMLLENSQRILCTILFLHTISKYTNQGIY